MMTSQNDAMRSPESGDPDLAITRTLMIVFNHAISARDFAAAADVAEQLVEHARRLRYRACRARHL